MTTPNTKHTLAHITSLLLVSVTALHAAELSFNRDIRPILSENCFYCHGQDPKHREAKLRLDLPEEAMRDRDGVRAVVPGKPDESEMIVRLLSQDRDEVMPPPKAHKQVTPEQITLLKRWISEGARYEQHWAFTPPRRAALPEVKNTSWARTEPDRFILARLEREGLTPTTEATPSAWLRRASFDLTGLAPTPSLPMWRRVAKWPMRSRRSASRRRRVSARGSLRIGLMRRATRTRMDSTTTAAEACGGGAIG
jgi:hypothetical protein